MQVIKLQKNNVRAPYTAHDHVAKFGHFSPHYITDDMRATVSRHNGRPILETYNPIYGYWATARDLTHDETVKFLGDGYVARPAKAEGK